MKNYDPKTWNVGDKVRPNIDFEWPHMTKEKKIKLNTMEGEVIRVDLNQIKVKWNDGLSGYYTSPNSSLVNLSNRLPDELFEI